MTMQAVPEQIRAASDAALGLAGQVGKVRLVAVADAVEDALPAAQSQQVAAALGTAWQDRVSQLARAVDDHATKLGAAATAYREQETLTADGFRAPW